MRSPRRQRRSTPRHTAAITYLRQRGIDATDLPAHWKLGYAPPGWTRLVDTLRGQFPDQALLDTGLARRSTRGTLIDTFRDRVIFPLHDADGHVAGFIGRDLSGDEAAPKYLPNGTDPADYLTRQNSTLDVFRDTHALPLLTIRVQRAIAAQGDRMQWIEGRLAAARTIAGYLATYPVSYAAAQIGWIGHVLDLDAATFTFELANAYRQPGAPPNGARPAALINPLDSDHAEPGRRTYEREVIT
jgi:hypothetical protein